MTAIPSPAAMKARVLELFVRYGPQVSRWGEQGFFQMLFWDEIFNLPSRTTADERARAPGARRGQRHQRVPTVPAAAIEAEDGGK